MLKIPCPFCGLRYENEFAHGGPARDRRPLNSGDLSDADWVEYLTVPDNPIGPVDEKWWHVRGCGQWFTVTRHTVTHDIHSKQITDGE